MKKLENGTVFNEFQNKKTQKQDFLTSLVSNSNCAITIQKLVDQGISVIPLAGKRPYAHLRWKQYQHRLPNNLELRQWLTNDNFSSYGIICGRVSGGLIVIDFDEPQLYQTFIANFPHLAQSYTVKTRRGFHIYLKTTFRVRSYSFTNCDIKGEGGYVVGAGSQIDGIFYTTKVNNPVLQITYSDWQSILNWLSPKNSQIEAQDTGNTLAIAHFKSSYLQRIPQMGRNGALYSVACDARGNGIPIELVIAELADIHSRMSPRGSHAPQTMQQRFKEAISTIKSAYGNTKKKSSEKSGLSNSLREAFLQEQNSSILPRLLDAMRLENWQTNTYFSLREAVELGEKYHISKRSIVEALTGDLSEIEGKQVFQQIQYHKMETSVSQGDKRELNSRSGRPTSHVYQVPSDSELCDLLNVPMTLSDKLHAHDLYSAAAYRRALHRELIRRLSPFIKVDWYAERLGVHRRTIFRYNRDLQVEVTPTIAYERLTEDFSHRLPEREKPSDNLTAGIWLQTRNGKRYPAFQSTAKWLLESQEGSILLCRQLPSRYELSSPIDKDLQIELPYQIRRRGTMLTRANIRDVMAPDWAVKKFDLGGYIAIYDGADWHFRPPLQSIAYQLVKTYEDGLVYFVRSRFGYRA